MSLQDNFRKAMRSYVYSVSILSNVSENKEYNAYIKQNNLNNSLAFDTKIVYTNNNKIPKPLTTADWIPSVAIILESKRLQGTVESYLNDLDLVIHYDDVSTPWANYVENI